MPELLGLLGKCLDFGDLFRCLVGRRERVDQAGFNKPLQLVMPMQFQSCVKFVVCLPYVKEVVDAGEFELDEDCCEFIFLKLKELFGRNCSKRFSPDFLQNWKRRKNFQLF